MMPLAEETRRAMSAHRPIISASQARRLLLNAQGLLDNPARRADRGSLRKLIEQLGYVQIDSINVVERAHHLTLHSRLDGYLHEMLYRLLERDRHLFEHWTHDASAIPVEWYPHWKHRFERSAHRIRRNKWWRKRIGEKPDTVLDAVRNRIDREGPLQSRDFEHADGQVDAWWGWKPQKAALEYLWHTGELAVVRRINFQKVYDLAERVLPQHHPLPAPEKDEHIDWACRTALERLVLATPSELAAFWHMITSNDARQWCAVAIQSGEAVEVMVESADGSKPKPMFALPDWEARLKRVPDVPQRVRLLSPFDPVLRDRSRAQRLFNFEYRFEAFVPPAKRRYGYYVMPLLEGDAIVGRIDPKFHRDESELVIQNVWWEPGVKPTKHRHDALDQAVDRLAGFIGADWWRIDA